MQKRDLCSLLVLLGALVGCESSDELPPAVAPSASIGQPVNSRIAMTAVEVAKERRGDLRCPPKITTAQRAASMPVDDVVGVRPGLTWNEAVNAVLCTHELLVLDTTKERKFRIQTYGQTIRHGFAAGFAEDRVDKTSQDIVAGLRNTFESGQGRRGSDISGGAARWYVTTMGLPGAEKVVAVARIEAFVDGKAPTVAAVIDALIEKYGVPTLRHDKDHPDFEVLGFEGKDSSIFNWSFDTFGRRITETSPLYRRCRGPSGPDDSVSLSPDCGVVVEAVIKAVRENPLLARSLQVGVVDQANGYEMLTATEQKLQEMEQKRRNAEAESARQHGDKPTL